MNDGKKSLAEAAPLLSMEWDTLKNLPFAPDQFTVSSTYSAYWHCAHGHSWRATIVSRYQGAGCPMCQGRKHYRSPFV